MGGRVNSNVDVRYGTSTLASTGQQSMRRRTTHFREPTPPLSTCLESPPGSNMPEIFDPVLDDDVEEEYGPSPIVGSFEPARLQQSQDTDDTLRWHRAINRVHLNSRGRGEGEGFGSSFL